jgi:hypothetical protein
MKHQQEQGFGSDYKMITTSGKREVENLQKTGEIRQ